MAKKNTENNPNGTGKGINLTPGGKKSDKPKSNRNRNKNDQPKQTEQPAAVQTEKTFSDNIESLNKQYGSGTSDEHQKAKEWADEFISVDLTPSPVHLFGTEFVATAKEFLYKSFDHLTAKASEGELTEERLPEWSDLLETYILENLSEEEKIAKIVTDENKDAFVRLVRIFLAEDDFRAHLLHLCASTTLDSEVRPEPEDKDVPPVILGEGDVPKERIQVDLTPVEPITGEVEGEDVYIVSKKTHVTVTEGVTKTVNAEDGVESEGAPKVETKTEAKAEETSEESIKTEEPKVEAETKEEPVKSRVTKEEEEEILNRVKTKQEKKANNFFGKLFKKRTPYDITQAILNRTVTPPSESRKFKTDFWKKAE